MKLNTTQRTIIGLGIAALVSGIGFLVWRQTKTATPTNQSVVVSCGDEICSDGEKKSCPEDCPKPVTNTNGSAANTNTSITNSSPPPAASNESHFGINTGSLTYAAALSYAADLGDIWIRDGGATNYRDDYGWGKTGYRNPATRTPLPSFQSNAFLTFEPNRYDDTQPSGSMAATYPAGHEQNFIDYINYLLSAYQNIITYWEVGNEVDLQFWSGTAEDYARTVSLASSVIEPECPSCKVAVSFSRPDVDSSWYTALSGICDSFDVIDVHLIEGFFGASFIQSGALDRWKAACSGKEFVSTETGIPDYQVSGKPQSGGSPTLQAEDLIKYNTKMFVEGYNVIFWYLIDTTYGEAGSGNAIFEHNALVQKDGTRKPAFTAYQAMIDQVDCFTSLTNIADGQYKYTFADKDPVYLLWCDSGSCSVPSSISGNITVTDYLGNEQSTTASQLTLTASPVYVTAR